ncbi:MAG: sigma-54-dependent Fis family transcriptional regulator [Nitrospiraceae bacterium]|nr:MAG: sigma-54-dependent Fis family transcriptional regulator [Nitrospiraceae bacterium]
MDKRLLIVEDEETLCESLKRVLSREGYVVDTVNTAESAITIQRERQYDLIVTDIILPGMTGIELIRKIKEDNPEQIVVVMTAYASLETAVEALRAGSYDYIVKPVMHEEIKQIVRNAINQKVLQKENLLLKCQLESRYDIETISLYKSPAMRKLIDEIKGIADSPANLLVLGETGTEKELCAKLLHSIRKTQKPFIPMQCSAADANSIRQSFEAADGGVIFLNDILCLSAELQAMLVTLLKERDLGIIAAADQNIESEMQKGAFSRELLRIIRGVTIRIPPLRERKEDIGPLANYFIQKYSEEFCRGIRSLDGSALEALSNYEWPGNVRELQNMIERAVLIARGEVIGTEHLPLN